MTGLEEQPVGPILDGLGITITVSGEDLISDALVLAKVISSDGEVSLVMTSNENLSWLDHIGMISAASDIVRHSGYTQRDSDE